jgi:hypothetical protein
MFFEVCVCDKLLDKIVVPNLFALKFGETAWQERRSMRKKIPNWGIGTEF